jgi:hypothetical protein
MAAGALCLARPALADPPTIIDTGGFFSSLKQALKQDLAHEIVRAHFDIGAAPDIHRFYCMVDPRNGRREPFGVSGATYQRPDGSTGVKAGGAVSPDSCEKAEADGTLVTSGYVLTGAAATPAATPAAKAQTPAGAASAMPEAAPVTAKAEPAHAAAGNSARAGATPETLDVAGVKLGMSPDQVRVVLRARALSDYYESAGALGAAAAGARFVNVIAAWTPGSGGESVQVLFTPTPGRERAMAVIHSQDYASADAIGAAALRQALVRKYGGFAGADRLPTSPTWRLQAGGAMQTGDVCQRRSTVGGLGEIGPGPEERPNLALAIEPQELRFQIEHCGVAIVTEDQAPLADDGARAEAPVGRFTVTAWSPAIALDGATAAARLAAAAGKPATPTGLAHAGDVAAPEL